jgi:hypothetical protein
LRLDFAAALAIFAAFQIGAVLAAIPLFRSETHSAAPK